MTRSTSVSIKGYDLGTALAEPRAQQIIGKLTEGPSPDDPAAQMAALNEAELDRSLRDATETIERFLGDRSAVPPRRPSDEP